MFHVTITLFLPFTNSFVLVNFNFISRSGVALPNLQTTSNTSAVCRHQYTYTKACRNEWKHSAILRSKLRAYASLLVRILFNNAPSTVQLL
jgi:hypothetical protein